MKVIKSRKYDGPAEPQRRSRLAELRSLPCVFLGEATGEKAQCIMCKRAVPKLADVFACEKHGKCTVESVARIGNEVLMCCQKTCGDYQAKSTAQTEQVLSLRENTG